MPPVKGGATQPSHRLDGIQSMRSGRRCNGRGKASAIFVAWRRDARAYNCVLRRMS